MNITRTPLYAELLNLCDTIVTIIVHSTPDDRNDGTNADE